LHCESNTTFNYVPTSLRVWNREREFVNVAVSEVCNPICDEVDEIFSLCLFDFIWSWIDKEVFVEINIISWHGYEDEVMYGIVSVE
jgi:hypothetical protein